MRSQKVRFLKLQGFCRESTKSGAHDPFVKEFDLFGSFSLSSKSTGERTCYDPSSQNS